MAGLEGVHCINCPLYRGCHYFSGFFNLGFSPVYFAAAKMMMLYCDKKVEYRYKHIDTGWADHEGGRDSFSSLDNQTALVCIQHVIL